LPSRRLDEDAKDRSRATNGKIFIFIYIECCAEESKRVQSERLFVSISSRDNLINHMHRDEI